MTLSSPLEGVVRVRIAHHTGGTWHGGFDLPGAVDGGAGAASVTDDGGVLATGPLVGARRARALRGTCRSRSTARA